MKQKLYALVGERHSEDTTDTGQNQTFGQMLPNLAKCRSAQGGSQREFAAASGITGQQKARYIRTGHQKHRECGALQNQQTVLRLSDAPTLQGVEIDVDAVWVVVRVRRRKALHDARKLGLRLYLRNSGLESADHRKTMPPALGRF